MTQRKSVSPSGTHTVHVRRAQSRGRRPAVATGPPGHATDVDIYCGFCFKVVTYGQRCPGSTERKSSGCWSFTCPRAQRACAGRTRHRPPRRPTPGPSPGCSLLGSPFLTAGQAPSLEQWARASAGFGDGRLHVHLLWKTPVLSRDAVAMVPCSIHTHSYRSAKWFCLLSFPVCFSTLRARTGGQAA